MIVTVEFLHVLSTKKLAKFKIKLLSHILLPYCNKLMKNFPLLNKDPLFDENYHALLHFFNPFAFIFPAAITKYSFAQNSTYSLMITTPFNLALTFPITLLFLMFCFNNTISTPVSGNSSADFASYNCNEKLTKIKQISVD